MLHRAKNTNSIFIGCLCAIISEVLFGSSYLFTKQVTYEVSWLVLLGWRFFVAFIALTICAVIRIIKINIKRKQILPLLRVAIFSPILYFLCETNGIQRTSASESGIFLACIPVTSLLASTFILKKKPTKNQIAGIAITLVGVIITVIAAGTSVSFSLPGYLFLCGAVLVCSLYSVFVGSTADSSGIEIIYFIVSAATVVFVSLALMQATVEGNIKELLILPVHNKSFLLTIIYQGVGCSILAFFMYNKAVFALGVNRTSSFLGISTVVSILTGVLILKEKLLFAQIMGAIVIIAGIYVANYNKKGWS